MNLPPGPLAPCRCKIDACNNFIAAQQNDKKKYEATAVRKATKVGMLNEIVIKRSSQTQ